MSNILLNNKRALAVVLGLLFLCSWGFLIYSNSLNSPFQFDDQFFILRNDTIKNINNVLLPWRNLSFRRRTVVFISFALNYHFSKENVFGYHIVNTLIHVFTAFAVWWFGALLLSLIRPGDKKNFLFSFFTALLFLVHPIQTQAVVYISQRFASLAALFYLLSVCCYIVGRKIMEAKGSWVKVGAAFVAVILFGLLGLLSKETVLSLPFALLLVEAVLFPRKILYKISIFSAVGITFFFSLLTAFNLKIAYLGNAARSVMPCGVYLLTQFKVVVMYIGLLLFPLNQNLDYDIPLSQGFWNFPTAGGFCILALIALFGIYMFRKNRLITLGIFWFFIALSVESSFFPIEDVMVEHRLYLPSVGFFIIIMECFRVFYRRRRMVLVFFCTLVAGLSLLTVKRNVVWQDPVLLWQDVMQKSPDKERAYHNLAFIYMEREEYDKALAYFNKVIAMNSRHFLAYMNRAGIYKSQGRYGAALRDYQRAQEIRPRHAGIYYNRGNLYFSLKKYELALADYKKAVSKYPRNYAKADFALGNTYKVLKDYESALKQYNKALALNSDWPQVYNNQGNVFIEIEKVDQAIKAFSKAIDLDPKFADAYNNRATAYVATDRVGPALQDYDMAIALNPDYAEAYYNRGNLYVYLGRYQEALEDYNMAIKINVLAQALVRRGMLYVEMGQLSLAVKDYQEYILRYGEHPKVRELMDAVLVKLENK